MSPKELPILLASVGLGLGLVLARCATANANDAPTPPGTRAVKTLYQRNRSFRIPFSVSEEDRARRREVQLWYSEDQGTSWSMTGRATPDLTSFVFRALRDGEYWFTVRTLDAEGQLHPHDGEKVEPRIKVVVDTVPPFLALEAGDRTSSHATVRWQVRDAHLDLRSLVLETQAAGDDQWRSVTIHHPSLIGGETWDTGTPQPLKVRVAIADKAGNRIESVLSFPKIPPVEGALDIGIPQPTQLKLASSDSSVPKAVEPTRRDPLPDAPSPPTDPRPDASPRHREPVSAMPSPALHARQIDVKRPEPPPSAPSPPAPLPTDPKPSALVPITPSPPAPLPTEPAPSGPDPSEMTPPAGFPPNLPATEPVVPRQDEKPAHDNLPADLPTAEPVVANPSFPPVNVGMLESDPAPTPPIGPSETEPTAPDRDAMRSPIDTEVSKTSETRPAQAAAPTPPLTPLPASTNALAGRAVRSVPIPAATSAPIGTDSRRPLRVHGPRFALPYTVEEAGPEGPAAVELWITQNNGQVWRRFGEDRDHKPPFEVELNAEGKFGFWLVARDARGEGDRPPKSGDRPQLWVEVRFDPRRNKPNIR